ncbi:MAG: cytochrome c [Actinobacteria bacterium]|nr:cytochrome c [Actinomycetota bacterium]
MRRAATIALLALTLALAGCGGGEEAAPLPETQEGTLPESTTTEETATTPGVEGDPAKGKSVYASAGCGGCHTLEAAGSSGSIGPDLDESKPDAALATDRVMNGRGAMPPFKDDLTEQEISDVVAFVVQSTSG